jgi:hypothetical protein
VDVWQRKGLEVNLVRWESFEWGRSGSGPNTLSALCAEHWR